MSDFLVELGANPRARKIIKKLGLPLPLPEKLRRAKGPMVERPLQDRPVVYATIGTSELAPACAASLAQAGADPWVVGDDEALAPFHEPAIAFGRPARLAADSSAPGRMRGVVLDASGCRDLVDLRELYDLAHEWVGRLERSGRLVVVSRPVDADGSLTQSAVRSALEGFVRSVAREIGRIGATANLLRVAEGAEDRVAGPLRFLLSERSAFVTAQLLDVDAIVRAPSRVSWARALDGKTALVTGAARGIGAATARALAAEGAHVVCLDRPQDDAPLSRVARETNGSALLVDLAAPDATTMVVDDLAGRGGVDIVVHNAGITRDRTLARMKPEAWESVLQINLSAVVTLTRALVNGPLRDEGRIVVLSSVAGIAGNVGQSNYAASKSALLGLVRHLAPMLAASGTTVNAVAPGFIETRMTAAIPVVIREVGRRLNALAQAGAPEDVANAITFLASDGASGLTGRVLRVCGGALMGA